MFTRIIPLRSFFKFQHLLPIFAIFSLFWSQQLIDTNILYSVLPLVLLSMTVMTAVHHADNIAHQIGEGLGTLVLALSVTIIEVGLILSLMGKNNPESSILARDTVFAAVMIVSNGIVALCLVLGGLKFKEQEFQVQGSKSLLVILITLSFLVFALPNYTATTVVGSYSTVQGVVIGALAFLLYILFIIFQTKTHTSYFEPTTSEPFAQAGVENFEEHAGSRADVILGFLSLTTSLIAVVGLAKVLSPTIEAGVVELGAPKSAVGLLIATLVLLPESWAAVSAARANRLQTSLNLAIGSGIASIALTIPVVIGYSIVTDTELILGLDAKNMTFMAMTFMVGIVTLGTGKSTLLQGAVHGVILIAYFLMSFIP